LIPRPRQFARPNPNHVDQRKRTTTDWNKIWRDTNCDYLREVVAAHVACTVALDRMAARYRYIYADTDICAGYRHNYVDGTASLASFALTAPVPNSDIPWHTARQTHQSQPSRFQIVRLDMHERAPRFRRNKFVRSIYSGVIFTLSPSQPHVAWNSALGNGRSPTSAGCIRCTN